MKQMLTNISERKGFAQFRRKVTVFRSFMFRSYQWIQVPGMILVMVGVIYPYLDPYIDISIWVLALLILVGMGIIGYVERYLGFFKEDTSYGTEQNRLLLRRLDDLENKLDLVINGKEEENINKETKAIEQKDPEITE